MLLRDEEQMKVKMRERRDRDGMRDKPIYQDLQKHQSEGRTDCLNQGKKESNVKVCEDGMKKT